MGHVDPVKGKGIRILSDDGGGSRIHLQRIGSMQISETARNLTCPKWVESYAPWMAEKVRKTGKEPKCVEDKNLLENKRIQKERKGCDNERSSSYQQAELFGDKCGDSNQHPRQKELEDKADRKLSKGKTIKKEECKEGDSTQANSSLEQAEPVKPIDGTKPQDFGKCRKGTTSIKVKPLEDTLQMKKSEDQNHPLLKTPKLGKKSYFLKTGLFVSAVLWSQFLCTMAADIKESPLTTEPAIKADLPYECTDAGSQPDDTWLDRKEVEAMIVGSVFDGSDRGFRDICPNAFHGLYLREIILTKNCLSQLSDHLFSSVQGLERVLFDHNHFTSVPVAFNEYPGIEFINISWNDINEITRGDLSNITSLQGLDVSGNKNLGQYPPDVFFLPHLRSVDVSNTGISSPPHPPCISSEMSHTYSIKCSENHVEFKSGSSKLIFYFQNLSAFYENCSNPEGMQLHSDCKTSTPEPVKNESFTDSVVSLTKSILHPAVSDDLSSVKSDNKSKGGPVWVSLVVILCSVSLLLKFVHFGYYMMVGLCLILLALLIGTFVVALVYFGILAALAHVVMEITVIVLTFDFTVKRFFKEFLIPLYERLSQNESGKHEVISV